MTLQRLNLALATVLGMLVIAVGTMRTDRTKPNLELMPDMQYSPAYQAFNRNPNFANGRTLQAPPAGSVDRNEPFWDYKPTPEDALRAGEELVNPVPHDDPAALVRGAEIYRINCQPCHGVQGVGDGPVALRGYPPPPSLLTGKSVQMKDGQLFHIVTSGQNAMAPYASQVSIEDRWNVIAHIRNLQATAQAAATATQSETTTSDNSESLESQP